MLNKTFEYKGSKFKVELEFKALCCGYTFKKDEVLTVRVYKTPNRLYINKENGSCHNVKRSTLNRCCILLEG